MRSAVTEWTHGGVRVSYPKKRGDPREPPPRNCFLWSTLHKLGALALVQQRQVRGAVEHVYTATVRISLNQEPL